MKTSSKPQYINSFDDLPDNIKTAEIPNKAKLLFQEIWNHTQNPKGYCYALNAYLAGKVNLTESTTSKYLSILKTEKFITIKKSNERREIYINTTVVFGNSACPSACPSLSAADIARLLAENALLKQQLDTLLSQHSDPKPTGGLTSAYKEEQFDPKLFEQQQNSNTEQKPDPVVVGNINALSQEVKNLTHEFPGVICNINEHNLATWAAGYNPDYITTGIRYAFLQSKHGTEPVRNMGAYINTTLPASDRETLQAMIDELSQCMPPYLRKTTAPPPPRSGYVPPNTVSAADPNPQPTHRVTLGALAAGIGDGMPQTPNERDRRRMLSGQAAQFRAQDGAKSD